MIFLKLVLAHLLGDFFFQPKSWIEDKERNGFKSLRLYLHVCVHALLLFLFLWDFSLWPLVLILSLLHLIIDGIKVSFQKERTKRHWFFYDQLLHLISTVALYVLYINPQLLEYFKLTETQLLFAVCMVFLTLPVAYSMQAIFKKWNIDELTVGTESLEDAGKYIGILERILVFIFIVVGHWEAVGFLITAKSVFRFGDLKESKHRKLTEYILIGTLISFGIAIGIGLLFLHFSNQIH